MLDGFWLFADADAAVSRERSRLDEYISLFKHACLLQKQVTLSDHMVLSSPNFRTAYYSDADFRKLAQSQLIRIAFSNQRGTNGPPMTLVELRDFHLRHGLGWPDIKEFFAEEANASYLFDLQRKPKNTRVAFNGSLRDPLFTAKILEQIRGDYLRRHLGKYVTLFEEIVCFYYGELSKQSVPLGIVYFVEKRPEWKADTIVDAFVKRLSDAETDHALQNYKDAIYRFAKSILTRSELDLMKLDPVLPPEEQSYVEVLHGRTVRQIVDKKECLDLKVYELSSDLDDALLYRHIDYDTILRLRNLDEAHNFFDAAEPGPLQPKVAEDSVERQQKLRAIRFEESLITYRTRLDKELRTRFSNLRKPSLERNVAIKVATVLNDATRDTDGNPRKILSSVVDCSIAVAAVHLGAADAWPLLRFLNTMLTTHLTKAERYMADVTEDLVKKMTADALTKAGHSKMTAYAAAPADLSTGAGFTVYADNPNIGSLIT
jgi:hypothetical protein